MLGDGPRSAGTATIGEGVDTLAAEDLDHLSDAALAGDLFHLLRERARLEAQITRRVARAHHHGIAATDGAATTAAWMRSRAGLGETEAQSLLRTATALEEMPNTSAAYAAGEIGTTRARMLTTARAPGYEEAFTAIEAALVEVARTGTLRDLRQALEHWRAHLDNDAGAAATQRLYERRGLWASRTLDGTVAVRADLDPEGGELLLAALAAHTPTPTTHDTRTPAQRRADTLTGLCRLALEDKLPGGTTRPHLSVIITADTLTDAATTAAPLNPADPTNDRHPEAANSPTPEAHDHSATPGNDTTAVGGSYQPTSTGHNNTGACPARNGGVCDLEYHGPVAPAVAIRLACDAAITRVVLGPHSRLTDVGRTTRVVPPHLRRALAARDRGCRFPGCDRPLAWCHAHHVIHWLHGGPTNHHNIIHVCAHHHHLLHEGGWTATFDGTALQVFRPDGTPLTHPTSPRAP